MDISRRFFLGGALVVAATAVVANPTLAMLAPDIPRIYGDGVHDDAPGLNACFAGRPFVCDGSFIRADADFVEIVGGVFLISESIRVSSYGKRIHLSDCRFNTAPEFKRCDSMFIVKLPSAAGIR